jgi:hypothetical protein
LTTTVLTYSCFSTGKIRLRACLCPSYGLWNWYWHTQGGAARERESLA